MQNKRLWLIGVGKMGQGMVLRLTKKGYKISAFDLVKPTFNNLLAESFRFYQDKAAFVAAIPQNAIVLFSLPASKITREEITFVIQKAQSGLKILDTSNGHYKESEVLNQQVQALKHTYFDVGVSGGPYAYQNGFNIMYGGDTYDQNVHHLLEDLAHPQGLLYTGKAASGHYLKMVHNAIEYGIMQSYAEGFNLLDNAKFAYDKQKVASLWNHGSIIESSLLSHLEEIYKTYDEDSQKVSRKLAASGEAKWALLEALELGVPMPAIYAALTNRNYTNDQKVVVLHNLIALMRNSFGGHKL